MPEGSAPRARVLSADQAPTTAERPAAPARSRWEHCTSAPALTSLAPPPTGYDPDDSTDVRPTTSPPLRPAARGGQPTATLRMTCGAREAAAGMAVTEADVQRCLDAPDDVSPDPTTPSRTRFRRGTLVVLAGAEGMVLRIDRRGR